MSRKSVHGCFDDLRQCHAFFSEFLYAVVPVVLLQLSVSAPAEPNRGPSHASHSVRAIREKVLGHLSFAAVDPTRSTRENTTKRRVPFPNTWHSNLFLDC